MRASGRPEAQKVEIAAMMRNPPLMFFVRRFETHKVNERDEDSSETGKALEDRPDSAEILKIAGKVALKIAEKLEKTEKLESV